MPQDEKKGPEAEAADDQRFFIIRGQQCPNHSNTIVINNDHSFPTSPNFQNPNCDMRQEQKTTSTKNSWVIWVIGIIASLILLSFLFYSFYQDGKKTEQINNNKDNIEKVDAKADKALDAANKAHSKAGKAEAIAKRAEDKADKALEIGEQNSRDIITIASYVQQEKPETETPSGDDEFTKIINKRVKKALNGDK